MYKRVLTKHKKGKQLGPPLPFFILRRTELKSEHSWNMEEKKEFNSLHRKIITRRVRSPISGSEANTLPFISVARQASHLHKIIRFQISHHTNPIITKTKNLHICFLLKVRSRSFIKILRLLNIHGGSLDVKRKVTHGKQKSKTKSRTSCITETLKSGSSNSLR